MATVTLARSLGRPLIKQLGLDEARQYLEGQAVEVSEEAEKELIKQSLVKSEGDIKREQEERERNIREQATLRAVAPAPAITAPATPATFGDNPHNLPKKKDS